MKIFSKLTLIAALGIAASLCEQSLVFAQVAPSAPAKNWTAPSYRIYAQTLSDEIMAAHPELISVTFHGVPPGLSKVYTMFAGSYPERIGNPDDPDDVMIIETGITILDPRWHRTKDPIRKFVPMLPLRDAAGENIGLLVLAYKNPVGSGYDDAHFFTVSTALRNELQKKIPSYAALFEKAK
ncbi:hypothetical protein ACO0K9_13905 [Undibacterium sp. Ji50W]|uniref:hypothetical protein n=1 Tax=Undibacterium sp. Ji50W TaxID=3413041 RepID=UPI003BEF8C57